VDFIDPKGQGQGSASTQRRGGGEGGPGAPPSATPITIEQARPPLGTERESPWALAQGPSLSVGSRLSVAFTPQQERGFWLGSRDALKGWQESDATLSQKIQNASTSFGHRQAVSRLERKLQEWFRERGTSWGEATANGSFPQLVSEWMTHRLRVDGVLPPTVQTDAATLDRLLYRRGEAPWTKTAVGFHFLRGLERLGFQVPPERHLEEAPEKILSDALAKARVPTQVDARYQAALWVHTSLGWRPSELQRVRGHQDIRYEKSVWWIRRFPKMDLQRLGEWVCLPPVPPWIHSFLMKQAGQPYLVWPAYVDWLKSGYGEAGGAGPPTGLPEGRDVERDVRALRTAFARTGVSKEATMKAMDHKRETTSRRYAPRPLWELPVPQRQQYLQQLQGKHPLLAQLRLSPS
jgi:hypothetical protein